MTRGRDHLIQGKAEIIGVAYPGEEVALGRPNCGFPAPKGSLQERWRGSSYKGMY